ncbi:hypothetical protein AC1031_014401 [Aphanomyces cochlioides]|nr:hypothetical protein AC1031_014401 [Aphanomyces cochlioides]
MYLIQELQFSPTSFINSGGFRGVTIEGSMTLNQNDETVLRFLVVEARPTEVGMFVQGACNRSPYLGYFTLTRFEWSLGIDLSEKHDVFVIRKLAALRGSCVAHPRSRYVGSLYGQKQ